MLSQSLRLIAVATILMAFGIVAVGCNPLRRCDLGNDSSGIPRCPLSASYLDQRPVAHLAYPGSKVISRQETDEKVGLDGNSTASVSSALTVDASPTAIRDWYVSKFQRMGWSIPALQASGYTPVAGTSDYLGLDFGRLPRESVNLGVVRVTGPTTEYSFAYVITSGGWRG